MRAVVTMPTDLPMAVAMSASVVTEEARPAAQSSTATSEGTLMTSLRVLMPAFSATAVGAESGVWPLVV